VRYSPITLAYRRAGRLSHEIARHRGLRATATGEGAEGLLIDAAELWELFLVHCARRAFGRAAVRHGTREEGQALLNSQKVRGAWLGTLYPDLLVGGPERPSAIIDAKYKILAHTAATHGCRA
jgi:5-methylcytosine-specific restriction enzyme subunit McrC